MTNKSSSGSSDNNNRIFQVIMAVITTIAAPVIVFLVTNNIKNSTSPTPIPTLIVQVVTATGPAGLATQLTDAATVVSATSVEQATGPDAYPYPYPLPITEEPAAKTTIQGITNPSGRVPAGTPVLVDGLLLTVSAEDIKAEGKTIHVSVQVKNIGDKARTLVFTPASISIKDDSGRAFEPLYGDKKSGCKKDDLNIAHTLAIEPQVQVTLASVSADKAEGWCAETPGSALPLFSGPVGKNTKKLEVQINGVGPFKGFQVEIGL